MKKKWLMFSAAAAVVILAAAATVPVIANLVRMGMVEKMTLEEMEEEGLLDGTIMGQVLEDIENGEEYTAARDETADPRTFSAEEIEGLAQLRNGELQAAYDDGSIHDLLYSWIYFTDIWMDSYGDDNMFATEDGWWFTCLDEENFQAMYETTSSGYHLNFVGYLGADAEGYITITKCMFIKQGAYYYDLKG